MKIAAAEHHIEHYNHMVLYELPDMIERFRTFFETKESLIELFFENVYVGPASCVSEGAARPLFPAECRRADLNYLSPIFASVVQKITSRGETRTTVLSKVRIAHLPTMVGSCICNLTRFPAARGEECAMDAGGYFLINGNERVLVTQEIKAYNVPKVSIKKNWVSSTVRSISEETAHSAVTQCMTPLERSAGEIEWVLPYVSKRVPLEVFVKALGFSPREMQEEVALEFAVEDTGLTREDCLEWIGQFGTKNRMTATLDESEDEEEEEEDAALHVADRIAYARQVVTMELFPHLGVSATPRMIFEMAAYMVRQMLLCKKGLIAPTEPDNLMYKRFENSGQLILHLYRITFKHFFGNVKKSYSGNNLNDMIGRLTAFVDKTVHSNFAKGVWGIQKNSYVRYGVSQILSRLSYIGTLSHLQRVSIPIGKEGKNVDVRHIHPSQFGYICLYETPEGKTCGIVLNMTVSARITRKYSTSWVRDLLMKLLDVGLERAPAEIWLNNTLKLYAADAGAFLAAFKQRRLEGLIPHYVNVYRDARMNVVHVLSEGGRITRPFHDRAGRVVWLDAAECQHSTIAMYPDEPAAFEYVEIHPSMVYGIAAGCIPFSDHNQSPRNVYESSMIKQALGIPVTNWLYRYDSSLEWMPLVQRSLVSTEIARAVGCADLPAGVNCIVAIMTCGSWNAEDSLVFNAAAVERGLFCSFTYKTLTSEELKKDTNIVRAFCLPPEEARDKSRNYDWLDERGIVQVGAYIQKKDVIVGRMCAGKDCSELADEEGIVERVELLRGAGGYMMAKIVLKVVKIPERGDKFANMCAQKGTIGMILPHVDMPFTEEGIVPDVVINPNALPSRMTISMFLEMVLGKHACLEGEFVDATPFSRADLLSTCLVQHGFEPNGTECMYAGDSGELLRSRIFIGTSFYQKLKHMVSNKIHARPFGNVMSLTRQPPSGRSKDGGLRVGEMERDALLSHGVSNFLTSRIFDRSDAFHVPICNRCRIMSNHKDECHLCKSTELFHTRLPFASKLLFQQLTACLLHCKFTSELL